MVYEWGARSFPIDANVAGEEVRRIAAKQPGQAALAATILEESRPKKAVLHAVIFSESDKAAAESWRLHRTRELVRSLIVVETSEDDEQKESVPAFYHVDFTDDGGDRVSGYQPVEVVVSDVGARASAEKQLLAELQGLRRRYDGLGIFSDVWAAVEKVAAKV